MESFSHAQRSFPPASDRWWGDIGNIIALSGRNSLSKVKRNIHETSIVYRESLWHVEIIADDIHH